MSGSAIAKRYALALLDLADESKQTSQVARALSSLGKAWETSAELRHTFDNPSVSVAARRKVLNALFTKTMAPPVLKNTLQLMNDRGRLSALPDMARCFETLASEKAGALRAEVTSAGPLTEAYYTQLTKTLENATGQKISIVRRQDPTLIAGVVTRIGDKVFDGSVRNRLVELQDQLLTP